MHGFVSFVKSGVYKHFMWRVGIFVSLFCILLLLNFKLCANSLDRHTSVCKLHVRFWLQLNWIGTVWFFIHVMNDVVVGTKIFIRCDPLVLYCSVYIEQSLCSTSESVLLLTIDWNVAMFVSIIISINIEKKSCLRIVQQCCLFPSLFPSHLPPLPSPLVL